MAADRSRRVTSAVLLVIGLVLLVPAVAAAVGANRGLATSDAVVGGVPVRVIAPEQSQGPLPAVVIAHGYAGSSTLMEPLGRVFARAGYLVALPDLSGHGTNPSPLPADVNGEALSRDVSEVVAWLAGRGDVDPRRIALIGHSMGAGAVVRFASAEPTAVRATVAISLPSAQPAPGPADLLLLVGSAEPARFLSAAQEELAEPGAASRRLDVIPNVEHISIVWAQATADASMSWIGSAMDAPANSGPLDRAWLWLLLMLVGGGVLAVPLARAAFPRQPQPDVVSIPAWWAPVLTLAAAIPAALLGSALQSAVALPVAVSGYLVVWFAVSALVVGGVGWTLLRARGGTATRPSLRSTLATACLAAYAVLLLVGSARLTWSDAAMSPPRLLTAALAGVAFTAYFWADEIVVRRTRGRRALLVVADRVVLVGALLAAVSLAGAPGILTLLVPFMVLLFVVVGWLGGVVASQAGSRLAVAVVQGVPLALVISGAFPLAM